MNSQMNTLDQPYRDAQCQTALGVPLEPGERVIGMFKTNYREKRWVFWVSGAALVPVASICLTGEDPSILCALVFAGLIALVVSLGFLVQKMYSRGVVVTDRRVMLITAGGAPRTMHLTDARDVVALREVTNARLSRIAADLVENYAAGQHPKTNPDYWVHTTSIELVSMSSKLRVPAGKASIMGPFLARCVFEPGFAAKAPDVPFDP